MTQIVVVVCQVLLSRVGGAADPLIENGKGSRPIDIARQRGWDRYARMLQVRRGTTPAGLTCLLNRLAGRSNDCPYLYDPWPYSM